MTNDDHRPADAAADDTLTRREWLHQTGRLAAGLSLAGGVGGLLTPRAATAEPRRAARTRQNPAPGANDTIVLALIGSGGMGRSNLRNLMNKPGVSIAAVCDPDTRHMAEAAKIVEQKFGKRPAEIKDFRRVLEMKDVDGVIIATPDHWHALPTIYACQAGKDVYCEKPISHNIVEGRAMVSAARRNNRVIQVNTWQRSTQHFLDAIEYVRSGKIGKVSVCRAWKVQDPKAATMGDKSPSAPPSELDYDLWVGPAEMVPYQENRCHYNFRWYFNYAGGMTGDWGVHMIDMVLLGMSRGNDIVMPRRISSYGGKLYTGPNDDRTTPDTQMAIYEFPGGRANSSQAVPDGGWIMQWEVHVGSQAAGNGLDGGRDHGSEFIGTEGRVLADRAGWSIFDKDGKPVEKPAEQKRGADGMSRHGDQWLECMKTRRQPSSDIASMHQTTTVCHLANLAYLHGGAIEWDAAREIVTNDKKAMNHLAYQRPYRRPWSLPRG